MRPPSLAEDKPRLTKNIAHTAWSIFECISRYFSVPYASNVSMTPFGSVVHSLLGILGRSCLYRNFNHCASNCWLIWHERFQRFSLEKGCLIVSAWTSTFYIYIFLFMKLFNLWAFFLGSYAFSYLRNRLISTKKCYRALLIFYKI